MLLDMNGIHRGIFTYDAIDDPVYGAKALISLLQTIISANLMLRRLIPGSMICMMLCLSQNI